MDQRNVLMIAVLTVLAVVMISVNSVGAVRCYHCISGKDDNCDDLKDEKHLLNCDDVALEEYNEYQVNRTYTMCRKFYQDVDGVGSRVVRSCATRGQPERGCIDRTGTKGVKLRYCECEGDGCNESSALTAAITATSLAAICALVLGRH